MSRIKAMAIVDETDIKVFSMLLLIQMLLQKTLASAYKILGDEGEGGLAWISELCDLD